MKILLLSDTHSHIDERILHYAKTVDEVWHAGDIGDLKVTGALQEVSKLRAVFGNIDNAIIRSCFPEEERFICEGVSVWMTHIGGYPPKYNKRILPKIEMDPPELFICGHSHILKVMPDKKNNLLHMNPGACGKHGIHKVRTLLRFEIFNSKISNLEVIELEKRS